MKKIVISWISCVLIGVGLMLWLGHDAQWVKNLAPQKLNPLVKADFSLLSGDKRITHKAFEGQYMLVYFGFTHCPDTCPTSLLLMQNALSKLEAKRAEKVQPLFITIDPERDTPALVRTYVTHFGPRMMGLSGNAEEVKHAADSFKVYFTKVPMDDGSGDYMMDHSGFIYLMGKNGEYLAHVASSAPESELEAVLKAHVH